jgi:hypothetical protein
MSLQRKTAMIEKNSYSHPSKESKFATYYSQCIHRKANFLSVIGDILKYFFCVIVKSENIIQKANNKRYFKLVWFFKTMLQHLVEIYNQKKTIFAIYNNNYIMNTTKTIQSALISVFSKKV